MRIQVVLLALFFACSCKQKDKEKSVSTTLSPTQSADTSAAQQVVDKLSADVAKTKSIPARLHLIDVLDSMKIYDKAIAHLDTLLLKDSKNSELWLRKGQLHEDSKDTAEAIRSYENAIKIYPSPENQLYLANLLAEHRDAKALALCNSVASMGMGRETDANCNFIAGVYFSRTGNAKRALQLFDKAINDNYTLMEAYMEKGFIYYDHKNYRQAMRTFETAITINNQYADAYYWKAKCLEAMGNKDEAVINYKRAAGLDKQMNEAAQAIKRLSS